jgi:hypothetical protein
MKRMKRIVPVISASVVVTLDMPAAASYQGLQLEQHTTVDAGGAMRDVWRVYAMFSDPNDYLLGVNGSPTLGALNIQTGSFGGPSGVFFNPGGLAVGNTAPSLEAIATNPDLQWGTFATIGVSIADQGSGPTGDPDETDLSPGFPNFINGSQISNSNMGWFVPGPIVQSYAGYAADGDAPLRVLMMQLTVNAGNWVAGTVNVFGQTAGGENFNVPQATFGFIPAPPAVILMIGFAMMTRRRRAH